MAADLIILPKGSVGSLTEMAFDSNTRLKSADAYVASAIQNGMVVANTPGFTELWLERDGMCVQTISCIVVPGDRKLPLLLDRYNKVSRAAGPMVTLPPEISAPQREIRVEKKTARDFQRMCEYAKKSGIWLYATQGHRTVRAQQALINYYTERDGAERAMRRCAPAGFSEHHSGLALDVNGGTWENNAGVLNGKLAWAWLAEHCFKFGFMIKNLKGKEHITGTQYEPWHIRHLGDVELCRYLHDHNLTLNEYLVQRAADCASVTGEKYVKAQHSTQMICWNGRQAELASYRIADDDFVSLKELNKLCESMGFQPPDAPDM